MPEEPTVIADDMVVNMVYVLHSQTGREIDRSTNPIAFIQGHDQVLPGLANALYGMSAGEEKAILVTPADGYGAYDEDNLQRVPRSILPSSSSLSLGQGVDLRNHETGQTYQAYVVEIGPEHVVLDHNLPLAGQTLYFHVSIVGVRPATAAELADGLLQKKPEPATARTVHSVVISYDDTGESRESRGFAFVEMPSEVEAQVALDGLNGCEVNGRLVILG